MMRNIYVLVFSCLFFTIGAHAADVSKVKGTQALIELKGEGAAPGDQYFTLDSSGKKRGLISIAKVKDDRAIAKIVKGKVEPGQTLEKRSGGTATSGGKRKKNQAASGDVPSNANSYWGGLIGISRDTMSVSVNNSSIAGQKFGDAAMSGIGFSAMAFFDYEVFSHVWFRGLGGIEGFNASGNSICGTLNSSACNASIYYISLDFVARYVFSYGTIRPWLGAGVALMFPASKSSTALDSASVSNTSVIQPQAGIDFFINKDMFVPVSLEYGMLPNSNEVTASWIEVRSGLGMAF